MASAESVSTPLEDEVDRAGDAMMLLISRSVWEVLHRQAVSEGCEPGSILSKAISAYIDAYGSDEARAYVKALEQEAAHAAR